MGMRWLGPAPSVPEDLTTKAYDDAGVDGVKTITLGGLTFVKLTQAAFYALGAGRPANTIYFIVG